MFERQYFSECKSAIGAQYVFKIYYQAGMLFIQRFQTIVNGVNKSFILQNITIGLMQADVSSLNAGVDYEFNNTD
jgi:hypothetical protein